MRGMKAALCALAAGLAVANSARGNELLKGLPADSWYQAPDTKMRQVCASETEFPTVRGSSGCVMVMEAWSGGAYDEGRKRMWIWGGGHGDYWGNEIYAFDLEALKWSRITNPSPVIVDKLSADPMPDGNPVSRHTYDGLAFMGGPDRLFAYGGSMAGNGYGTTITWVFDPVAKTWTNRKPSGEGNRPQTNCCNFSGEYDPVTRKVFMRDPNWLCVYDYDSNSWSHVHERSHTWGPQKGLIDAKRRLFFTIGSEEFLAYDIAADKDVTAEWKTTGGDSAIDAYGVGAAFDTKADRIVAWTGSGVFTLDMDSRIWSKMPTSGGPKGRLGNGTFGRFRYVPDDNVFVLINGVDENVWFYKLTAGAGATGLQPRSARTPPREARVPATFRSRQWPPAGWGRFGSRIPEALIQ